MEQLEALVPKGVPVQPDRKDKRVGLGHKDQQVLLAHKVKLETLAFAAHRDKLVKQELLVQRVEQVL